MRVLCCVLFLGAALSAQTCFGTPTNQFQWDPTSCKSVLPPSGLPGVTVEVYSHRDPFLAETKSELVNFGPFAAQHYIPPPGPGGVPPAPPINFRRTKSNTSGLAIMAVRPNPQANHNLLYMDQVVNGETGLWLRVDGREEIDFKTEVPSQAFGFEFKEPVTNSCASVFELTLYDPAGAPLGRFQWHTNRTPGSPGPSQPQYMSHPDLLGQRVFIGFRVYGASFQTVRVREPYGGGQMGTTDDDERFGPFYFSDGQMSGHPVTVITDCTANGSWTQPNTAPFPPQPPIALRIIHANMVPPGLVPGTLTNYWLAVQPGSLLAPTQLSGDRTIIDQQVVGRPLSAPGPLFGLHYDIPWLQSTFGVPFLEGPMNGGYASYVVYVPAFAWELYAVGTEYAPSFPFVFGTTAPTKWQGSIIPALQWQ